MHEVKHLIAARKRPVVDSAHPRAHRPIEHPSVEPGCELRRLASDSSESPAVRAGRERLGAVNELRAAAVAGAAAESSSCGLAGWWDPCLVRGLPARPARTWLHRRAERDNRSPAC